MKGIKIAGTAVGGKSIFDGMWVQHYNPDGRKGVGELMATPFPEQARKFKDFNEAVSYWRQQSTVIPYRSDGKPNRPLTAYNVEILDLPGESE